MQSMEIKVIRNIDEEFRSRWDKFVLVHPKGNFFQSPSAYEFFSSIDGYEPVLIAAGDENEIKGILSAVIIKEPGLKGYFSGRCIVWGGPVCEESKIADQLLQTLNITVANKTIYSEFRNLFDLNLLHSSFIKNNYIHIDWLSFIVNIKDENSNLKLISESKRRQIKKSFTTGVNIREAQCIDDVNEFYNLLIDLYRTKIKKPLPSFNFFRSFFEMKEIGKIFLVFKENKIIGGSICPVYKDRIYEWYICGEDRKYKDIYPSVVATWAPISYAAKNGLKVFDFMGAGSPTDDYGVREFKAQFGGNEVKFGRYLRINNKVLYNIGKLGLKLVSLLK